MLLHLSLEFDQGLSLPLLRLVHLKAVVALVLRILLAVATAHTLAVPTVELHFLLMIRANCKECANVRKGVELLRIQTKHQHFTHQ